MTNECGSVLTFTWNTGSNFIEIKKFSTEKLPTPFETPNHHIRPPGRCTESRTIIFENPHGVANTKNNMQAVMNAVKETAKTVATEASSKSAGNFAQLVRVRNLNFVKSSNNFFAVVHKSLKIIKFTNIHWWDKILEPRENSG